MQKNTVPRHSTWTVSLERTEFLSGRPFDDVLAALEAGLGHPDFGEFIARTSVIAGWDEYRDAVEAEAGSSGLMVFLKLDVGSVIGRDPDASAYRIVRIIAGNPVTMESMARSTPSAAAFAPVTILVYESADGVRVRYDSITSAIGEEASAEALAVTHRLDESVIALITSAC